MDPNALLEQLRDAHAPETLSWWPPAIGWWMLALLVLVSLFFTGRAIYLYRKKSAWKRQALKEYKSLKQTYISKPTTQNLTNIIVLMRRCIASQSKDRNTLSLVGDDWKPCLLEPAKCLNEQDISILTTGHYQIETPLLDSAALLRIEKWIKRQSYESV